MFCLNRICPCQGVSFTAYLSVLNLNSTCVPKPELTTQTHYSLSLLFTAFVPCHYFLFHFPQWLLLLLAHLPLHPSHPPYPNSPPQYPDLYGKRRQTAKVQMLDREIGFLQEDLKSTEALQPATRCCKEVADYVVAKSHPLIPTYKKHSRRCQFWQWLCGFPCCKLSRICCCCYAGCSIHLEIPPCCSCNNPCKCLSCGCCNLPKWKCYPCPALPQCSCSCPIISCSQCCHFSLPSCPECKCCCNPCHFCC